MFNLKSNKSAEVKLVIIIIVRIFHVRILRNDFVIDKIKELVSSLLTNRHMKIPVALAYTNHDLSEETAG